MVLGVRPFKTWRETHAGQVHLWRDNSLPWSKQMRIGTVSVKENVKRGMNGREKESKDPSTMDNTSRKKLKQVWRCDACNEPFPSIEKATDHENECHSARRNGGESKTAKKSFYPNLGKRSAASSKTFEQAMRQKDAIAGTLKQTTLFKVQPSECDVSLTLNGKEDRKKTSKSMSRSCNARTGFNRKPKLASKQGKISFAPKPDEDLNLTGEDRNVIVRDLADSDEGTKDSAGIKRGRKAHKRKPAATTLQSTVDLNEMAKLLGVPPKTLLGQQKAVESLAKRHQQERSSRIQPREYPATRASSFRLGLVEPRRLSFTRAIQFPKPSHIFNERKSTGPQDTQDTGKLCWLSSDAMTQMQTAWSTEPRWTKNQVEGDDVTKGFVPLLDDCRKDCAAERLPSCLLSSQTDTSPFSLVADNLHMQVLPDDLCGESIVSAFHSLYNWIQEWKVIRTRCVEQMEARQEKLLRDFMKQTDRVSKSKPKKLKRVSSRGDGDYLFDDSDDESNAPPSLCLLSGPVGCGKTDLVHALARHCNCNILELNTAKNRSAVSLKAAIGEATQALASTISPQSTVQTFFGAAQASQESQRSTEETTILDDSDDQKTRNTALTVILIDEVDNLYEEDNGFWPALFGLSRKAKCPIFLTANTVPHDLRFSTISYMHEELKMPKPSDCVNYLSRKLGLNDTTEAVVAVALRNVGCDMRRFVHQLGVQLATFSADKTPDVLRSHKCEEIIKAQSICVESVAPRVKRFQEPSLLTISGSGFLQLCTSENGSQCERGHPVDVVLGEHTSSPAARILNDSTILAVFPPIVSNIGISYTPIRVCGTARLGILTDSTGCVSSHKFQNGSFVNVHDAIVNIELHPPAGNPEDEDENEFVQPGSRKHIQNQMTFDKEQALSILNDGLDDWFSRHPGEQLVPGLSFTGKLAALDELATSLECAQLRSDSSFVKDNGRRLPHLAGPVLGFGYHLTDFFPKYTNENNKRCAFFFFSFVPLAMYWLVSHLAQFILSMQTK